MSAPNPQTPEELVELLCLKNYPQRELTHYFVEANIRSAFLAGFRAGRDAMLEEIRRVQERSRK